MNYNILEITTTTQGEMSDRIVVKQYTFTQFGLLLLAVILILITLIMH
jgi:hypothetical protein